MKYLTKQEHQENLKIIQNCIADYLNLASNYSYILRINNETDFILVDVLLNNSIIERSILIKAHFNNFEKPIELFTEKDLELLKVDKPNLKHCSIIFIELIEYNNILETKMTYGFNLLESENS